MTRQVGLTPVSAEPALAVDPANPRKVVLAVSALDLPSPVVYVSDDGGGTWDGPIQVPVQAGKERSIGAPVVAFDRQGVLFLIAQTVRTGDLEQSALPVSVVRSRLSVARSDDGGRTWQSGITAVQGETNLGLAPDANGSLSGGLSLGFLDSPSLVIAPNPQRPERDVLTLVYTEFQTRFNVVQTPTGVSLVPNDAASTIRMVQSMDDGVVWSTPVSISPPAMRGLTPPPTAGPPPDTIDVPVAAQPPLDAVAPGDQVVQGPHVAAFADGSLAVAYLDSTLDGPQQGLARVMVATSVDGGRTFVEPVIAAVFREIAEYPSTAFFRWWDSAFPSIAAASDDDLAIVAATSADGNLLDDSDLLIAHSSDRGATWDAPVTNETMTSGSAFFPALSAAPGGTLNAAWLALGEEPAGAGYDLRLASSPDGGITWSAGEESAADAADGLSNSLRGYPGGIYLGSRIAMAATDERLLVAWPESSAAAADHSGQQIQVRLIPAR